MRSTRQMKCAMKSSLHRVIRKSGEKEAKRYDQIQGIEWKSKHETDKVRIVLITYAVIKPDTVMVKLTHTPIALFTVFRTRLHMCAADLAH